MKYTDERLYNTKNNTLIKNSIIDSYNNLYYDLRTKRSKYHPYDYILKVCGLCCINDSLKSHYKQPYLFLELIDGVTKQDIVNCLRSFDLKVWQKEVANCIKSFGLNPHKRTSEILNILFSVIRFGALIQYAEKIGVITDIYKYKKVLTVCQKILICEGEDEEQNEKLKGIYKYITIQVQSVCALLDEGKADDVVFGFLGDILEILYYLQHKDERYKTDGVRRELYNLFGNTIKDVDSQNEDVKESVRALNSIGKNGNLFGEFVTQVNPQYLIILFADRLFNDTEEKAYIVLNPSKTNVQILTELEYYQYANIYNYDTGLICTLNTVSIDSIKTRTELREIVVKWVKEIIKGLRSVFAVELTRIGVTAKGTNN